VQGHALLNAESLVALSFLLAVFLRSKNRSDFSRDVAPTRYVPMFLALCCAILLVYWPLLDAPFVYDDYTHITDARNSTWQTILDSFGPVEHKPGLFFRPFGFFIYWLNYLVAGTDPRMWHASSMILHASCSCLLFALCRELGLSNAGSFGAALLFTLSGAATEGVAWIDGRFDPTATFFVLLSLLCLCRYLASGRSAWMASACVAGISAVLSKESAFCLPLLAGCLWFFRPADQEKRRLIIGCAFLASVAVAVFVYRYWALGGIGGYRTAEGGVNIGQFSAVRMLNAVLVRDWTILFFPINWSRAPGTLLTAFVYSAPIALAACAWRARLPRRILLGCLALTVAAALPVQHLILFGADLANTRIIYLLAVGWAVLWGVIFTAIPPAGWRTLAMAWVIAWNVLMLHHNLGFWLRVPAEARAVCEAFGISISGSGGHVVVGGLPQKKDGVVFLANGFPECVAMNSNAPASRISVTGEPNYMWDWSTGRVKERK
jgi:hypothetical protein